VSAGNAGPGLTTVGVRRHCLPYLFHRGGLALRLQLLGTDCDGALPDDWAGGTTDQAEVRVVTSRAVVHV
jgi:hypothetical protein